MNRFRKISILLVLLSLFGIPSAMAQLTKIMGSVNDGQTGEPIPFANVYFAGTTIGVTSDFDGKFSIEATTQSDTLISSVMGYIPEREKISPGHFQEIHFVMTPQNFNLPELVIHAGENPADIILRKIIANKEKNQAKEFDSYQYEAYNKIEIDANNITEKFQKKRIFKPFDFIFDHLDTSSVNGKTYLPIFLSESISDIFFRKNPQSEKEVIKAAKVSGVKNESALQFLGSMFQKYDFYANYITIFQKNFVSPVSNTGLSSYKYYLVDSSFLGNKWCYQIMFKPRRAQELTFTGHFWVNDTSYAIKSFELKIAEDANINYINDLLLRQDFDLFEGKYWMVTRDEGIGDFNVLDDNYSTMGFFGKKTTTSRNFIFNSPRDRKFYALPTDIIVDDKAYAKDEEFWETNRHTNLNRDEQTIYNMVDTLRNLPAFKTWVDIVQTLITGYYSWDKFEFGPYASMLSFNTIEGSRFRIGGRTTAGLNPHFRLEGHLAYGTKDQIFKYGMGALFLPRQNPRRAFGVDYLYDVEQLGSSPNAFREDFFFAALFRRNPADKLSLTREFKTYYEHEWFTGLSNTINYMHKEIIPVQEGIVKIVNDRGETVNEDKIVTAELGLNIRFAFNEKFIQGEFDRYSVGTKFPIVSINYAYGIPNNFGSEYQYHRLSLGIKHWFNVFNLGWSKYRIEAGKTWGTLPYPLLTLHPGNETFLFDEYSYNLMDLFEFVSDEYVSVYYTHHFDGLFLNHIPVMRKLKWREVGYVKGVIGTLSDKNKAFNVLPPITHTLEKPYVETGVGIENIFKIIRVDGIWRVSQLQNSDSKRFAFFLSLYFAF